MVNALQFSERIVLEAPVHEVWRFLYDTDRLNRTLGLPTVSYVPDADPARKGHYAAEARLGPIPLRYEEFPFEWVENRYYRVLRRFRSGPFREIQGGVRMEESAPGRTSLEVFADVVPRHALGRMLARLMIRKMAISGVLAQARAFEEGYKASGGDGIDMRPAAVVGSQLDARLSALAASPVRADLVPRLSELLRHGSDIDVTRIRPFELADRWGVVRMDVLRFVLYATRSGVVDLNWEIVCPHCRSAAAVAPSLAGLAASAACATCETTFQADFAGSVEAVFSVNPGIRAARRGTFCIGGPANTPRIVAQFRLEPGERRAERVPLAVGRMTARCYQSPGLRPIDAFQDEKRDELRILCRPDAFSIDSGRLRAGAVQVALGNELPGEALVVLEKETWRDTAATASVVASIQEFRDLFPEQAVAPGQEIRVGRMAVLFTDLQGSTELYSSIGDIRAFNFVHGHFQFLTTCVARNNGGVVKTIGDAIMATFATGRDAIQAGIDMQSGWKEFLRGQKVEASLGLRVGIHEGPAVAFNNRGLLDFFGTTVNMAARVEGTASSGDVVFSAELAADPDASDVLRSSGRAPEPFLAELKGISGAQPLTRLRFAAPAGK